MGDQNDGNVGHRNDEGADERDLDEWIVRDEGVEPEALVVEGEEGYTCGVCGEMFGSPEELHKHLYRVGLVE